MTNTTIEQTSSFIGCCWGVDFNTKLDGTYCITYLEPSVDGKGRPMMKHIMVNTAAEAAEKALLLSAEGKDTYFAMAKYEQGWHPDARTGKNCFRTQENVDSAHGLWADMDCGVEKAAKAEGYPTKIDALKALGTFLEEYSIFPPTYIVDSGNGLHVHWVLDEAVDKDRWDKLTKHLKAKARASGLLIDNSRTTDIASVLRVPGTNNYKDKLNPLPVHIMRTGEVSILEALETALSAGEAPQLIPRQRKKRTTLDAILRASGLEETPENIALVREMLAVLLADCDHDTWLKIVFAIASLGWECSEELAREWSKTAPDAYEKEAFDKLWESYEPGRPGGITVSTLFHLATEGGWVNQQTELRIADPTQYMTGFGGDISNGKLFAHYYRGRLVFIPELNEWIQFDESTGWVYPAHGEVERAAKETVQTMRKQAAKLYKENHESPETKRLMKHVEVSSKMPKIHDMINAAKSEPGMALSLNEFDADLWLLGVANGVIDLRTNKLLPVTPDSRVTKRCNVEYDRKAVCQRFLKFLSEIMPDSAMRDFIQRWAGYCLTGEVGEKKFLFMFGSGDNGKTRSEEHTSELQSH